MKAKDFPFQGFATAAVFVGLIVYIAIDSGLISAKPSVDSVTKNGTAQTKVFQRELEQINSGVANKKAEVEDLTGRLASLELKIQKRLLELTSSEKPNPVRQQSSKARNLKNPSDVPLIDVIAPAQFLNFAQIEKTLQRLGQGTATVADEGEAYLLSHSRPFAQDSIYLRGQGILWAQVAAKIAKDLGQDKIMVQHPSGPGDQQRADVLKNYLGDLLGRQFQVLLEASAELGSSSTQFNIRVDKNMAAKDMNGGNG